MIEKYGPTSLTFPASGGNTQSFTFGENNGLLSTVVVQMPNFTNSVTGTLSMTNQEGQTLLNVSSIPSNGTTVIQTSTPIAWERVTFSLALSGDPGGSGGTATVTIYLTNYRR